MTEQQQPYDDFHLDALKEIGNIGAGNATTALSNLLSKSIDMSVPEVNILPFDEVTSVVGGPEELVAGIYLQVEGEAPGSLMLLLEKEDAVKLISVLMTGEIPENPSEKNIEDMEESALMETGNILASSYVTALSEFTGLSMAPTVPAIAVDMAGAILEIILIQVGDVSEHVLMIGTEFTYDKNKIRGHFFFIPEDNSFRKILKSLGIDDGSS